MPHIGVNPFRIQTKIRHFNDWDKPKDVGGGASLSDPSAATVVHTETTMGNKVTIKVGYILPLLHNYRLDYSINILAVHRRICVGDDVTLLKSLVNR